MERGIARVDSITLGAFVRSGNHFFQRLVDISLVGIECDWLSHRISDWGNKPNKVTIVRHPLDSISSWISTTRDKRIDRSEKVLEWFISYHEEILNQEILILQFDDLISDPLGSINKVSDRYGLGRSFFSNNDTLLAAMGNEFDFVWANDDKSDYPIIQEQILSSRSYIAATGLFEKLIAQSD
jgi:hypothetical protein